jgi:hypothetical protein
MIFPENHTLQESMPGSDPPCSLVLLNTRRSKRAPRGGFQTIGKMAGRLIAPALPDSKEALRQGPLDYLGVIPDVHGSGVNARSRAFLQCRKSE